MKTCDTCGNEVEAVSSENECRDCHAHALNHGGQYDGEIKPEDLTLTEENGKRFWLLTNPPRSNDDVRAELASKGFDDCSSDFDGPESAMFRGSLAVGFYDRRDSARFVIDVYEVDFTDGPPIDQKYASTPEELFAILASLA